MTTVINVLEVSRQYQNEWVVLDRRLNILDHGPDLALLWDKYGEISGRLTFYFASGMLP
ncbi:MAG: hypothetical protein HY921_10080 [Elusimicrobia bacterium]|nr:hypothetical protein [Elusimicrobiota bacterium]